MSQPPFLCEGVYVRGYRFGDPCPYAATSLVNHRSGAPGRYCGYHVRAYTPNVVYPLDWSLARIRQWQMDNLNALLAEPR